MIEKINLCSATTRFNPQSPIEQVSHKIAKKRERIEPFIPQNICSEIKSYYKLIAQGLWTCSLDLTLTFD
jgi:DNA replicative helicase MCM subunit Mcm2 (Cdc46/Mcm family)